eukprot:TRINITY_DN1191_c0_g1_i1.p1 TRINITY_DN1191_c0_g1~~TRINITY_DN1191_c0_g1_i1.p1  ORF type:complete len:317 (+),score=75.78 TRINITY_DN1191_c0_g1_i1:68-1018(+)
MALLRSRAGNLSAVLILASSLVSTLEGFRKRQDASANVSDTLQFTDATACGGDEDIVCQPALCAEVDRVEDSCCVMLTYFASLQKTQCWTIACRQVVKLFPHKCAFLKSAAPAPAIIATSAEASEPRTFNAAFTLAPALRGRFQPVASVVAKEASTEDTAHLEKTIASIVDKAVEKAVETEVSKRINQEFLQVKDSLQKIEDKLDGLSESLAGEASKDSGEKVSSKDEKKTETDDAKTAATTVAGEASKDSGEKVSNTDEKKTETDHAKSAATTGTTSDKQGDRAESQDDPLEDIEMDDDQDDNRSFIEKMADLEE